MRPATLCLFDIDGTILTSGGAGEEALRKAARDFAGADDDLAGVEISGRTDKLIAMQICRRHGREPSPENITAFINLYLAHLEPLLPVKKGRLLPGIPGLLAALKADPRVALGLLTGNVEKGARLKLSHYGVWDYFEFGAFADDSHDRNELGPFAMARAAALHGAGFDPARTFVIGDTPHDVACGKAIGAKTVVVATGSHPREELAACGPDFLFDDLSDAAAVLAALDLA